MPTNDRAGNGSLGFFWYNHRVLWWFSLNKRGIRATMRSLLLAPQRRMSDGIIVEAVPERYPAAAVYSAHWLRSSCGSEAVLSKPGNKLRISKRARDYIQNVIAVQVRNVLTATFIATYEINACGYVDTPVFSEICMHHTFLAQITQGLDLKCLDSIKPRGCYCADAACSISDSY
jgi:hypothetical protein